MPNLVSSQNISRQIQLNAEMDLKQRRSIFTNSKYSNKSPFETSIQEKEQGYDNFLMSDDVTDNAQSGWLRQSRYGKQNDECENTTLFEQYVLNPKNTATPIKEKKQ